MRIGVFGGSFDPIHHAHLILAQSARDQLALDEVRFVVAARQPLKQAGHHATAEQRAAMVARAIAPVPDFVLDRRELDREGPSYTVDTLRSLAADHPGAELVLLIGADSAAKFDAWYEPAAIRAIARVAVCARDGKDVPPGFDMTVTIPRMDLSATGIRARIEAGKSVIGWVPEGVADYIAGLRLYRSDG